MIGPIGLTPIEAGRTYLLRVTGPAHAARVASLRADLDDLERDTGARFRVLVGVDYLGTADRSLVDEIERLTRDRAALLREQHEVDQTIGQALGYPNGYPEVSDVDDDGVVTGEHTIVSLAGEIAARLTAAEHPDFYVWTNPLNGETARLAPWDITRVNPAPPTDRGDQA